MPTIAPPPTVPHGLTPAWYPLRPHRVQSRLWRTPKRFAAIPAGRGSGKTTISKRRLIRYLPVDRQHGHTHLYAFLAPTRDQAKRVAWTELKALTPTEWLSAPPSEGELIIRTRFSGHAAELHVIGMDKPQRFEGNQWDGVVVDESSDQKPGVFDLTIRPALTHRRGWCWRQGVPKRQGIGSRDFRAFCELGITGKDPDVETFTWPSWDILPADEIEAARRNLDEKDFNEQYGAAWESIGGAAFYAFDRSVHATRQVPYDPTRPILVGSDFNVDPMAWIVSHTTADGKGLETFDEVWLRGTNTQKTLDLLWDRYGENHKGGWIFYGDATGKARRTSANSSDYAQIRNDKRFRARVIYPNANPAIKDRLSSCNALFRNAAGDVRWWIDPRCVHLIADLEHRGLDKDGLPVDANKDGGHITDAAGYLVHAKWPATRVEPQSSGQIGVFYGD